MWCAVALEPFGGAAAKMGSAQLNQRNFERMSAKPRPIFARRIFWDVDFDRLDHDGKAGFIIERVFERGDVEDIRQCRRYYGDEQVIAALLNAKFLRLDTLHFVSAIFEQPLEAFRCYALRRSNPELFPY